MPTPYKNTDKSNSGADKCLRLYPSAFVKLTKKVRMNTAYVRKDGTCALQLQVYLDGRQAPVRIPLNLHVAPKDWDDARQRIRDRHPDSVDYQQMIQEAINRTHDLYKMYRLRSVVPTNAQFKYDYIQPDADEDFLKWWWNDVYNREDIGEGTRRQHKSALSALQEFCQQLPFHSLTEELVEDYVYHLEYVKENRPHGGRLKRSTVENHKKNLKCYLNRAAKYLKRKGHRWDNPVDALEVRKVKGSRDWLRETELKRLFKLYRHPEALYPEQKRVLAYFLFACCTGLRISDIKRVERSHIDADGWLTMFPWKTRTHGNLVRLPLPKPALAIVAGISGKLFNCFSDQHTNRVLKIICALANINKQITMHSARHTFATQFMRDDGKLGLLAQVLGVSQRTAQLYDHSTEDAKLKPMRSFDKYWEEVA